MDALAKREATRVDTAETAVSSKDAAQIETIAETPKAISVEDCDAAAGASETLDLSGFWFVVDDATHYTYEYQFAHEPGASSFSGQQWDNNDPEPAFGIIDGNQVSWVLSNFGRFVSCSCTLTEDCSHVVDGRYWMTANPDTMLGTFTGARLSADDVWKAKGGKVLEESLENGWVAVLDAAWLVQHAEAGERLKRRQDMPASAFVDWKSLKADGLGPNGNLRIIILSYMWLTPAHPDPNGTSIVLMAQLLKYFLAVGGRFGVIIDFACLYQPPRTAVQDAAFGQGLKAFNRFYSHPNIFVWQIKKFPPGYPAEYDIPIGANNGPYMERGWCFTEDAMSSLTKKANSKVSLDIAADVIAENQRVTMDDLLRRSAKELRLRKPPLKPEDFDVQLQDKQFTSKLADFELVRNLYQAAFLSQVQEATSLGYEACEWEDQDFLNLASVLAMPNLKLEALRLWAMPVSLAAARIVLDALRDNDSVDCRVTMTSSTILKRTKDTLLKEYPGMVIFDLQDGA